MNARYRHAALAVLAIAITPAAHADAVTEWNQTAEAATNTLGGPPLRHRGMTIVQVAVHDALNSIDARYESYLSLPPARAGASPGAAIAAASHRALSQLVPGQAASLALTYAARLAALPACAPAHPSCIQDGIDAGILAADAILTARNGDGSASPNRPYTLPAGPG